jgi:hypothetical protein
MLKHTLPIGNKRTVKPDVQPISGDDQIPGLLHASPYSLYYFHFSTNKTSLIFGACVPAFDFCLSTE